jgi:hypothetical protein
MPHGHFTLIQETPEGSVFKLTEVSDLAFRQIPHMPEVPEASYCSQLLA